MPTTCGAPPDPKITCLRRVGTIDQLQNGFGIPEIAHILNIDAAQVGPGLREQNSATRNCREETNDDGGSICRAGLTSVPAVNLV